MEGGISPVALRKGLKEVKFKKWVKRVESITLVGGGPSKGDIIDPEAPSFPKVSVVKYVDNQMIISSN